MSLFRQQLAFVRAPARTVTDLTVDPNAALAGFRSVLATAVLYEFAIVLWSLSADGPTLPPFLKIPEHQYYLYELVFLIPLFILTWLLASSIAYLASKALGGSGSFDTILAGYGLATAVSAYFTLIPDYVQGFLWITGWVSFSGYQEAAASGIPLLLTWAYLVSYVLAHLVLYAVTLRHAQGLGRRKAAVVAFTSFFLSFAIWITYVR